MSMAAPVVPIHEARNVPTTSTSRLALGVPRRSPSSTMPPAMVNSAQSSTMNGT